MGIFRNAILLLILSPFSMLIGAYNVGDTITDSDQSILWDICYEVNNEEIAGEYPEGQMKLSDFNGDINDDSTYSILVIRIDHTQFFAANPTIASYFDSYFNEWFDYPEIKFITNLYQGWTDCIDWGDEGIAGFPLIFSTYTEFLRLFYTDYEINAPYPFLCCFPTYIIIDHTMTVRYEYLGNPGSWEMNSIIEDLYNDLIDFTDDDDDECNTSAGDLNEDGIINIQDLLTMVNHILGNSLLSDCALEVADMNDDGLENILDLVILIDIILSS